MMSRKRHVSSAIYEDYNEDVLVKQIEGQIRSMRVSRSGGRAKPHKLVMLLSVTDMIESGLLVDGRVYFNEELLKRFSFYFGLVGQPTDSCRPHIPFFHLRTLGWWLLQPKIGRELCLASMKTCHSAKDLFDNVECALISSDVYDLLCNPRARRAIRRVICEIVGMPDLATTFYHDAQQKE